MSTNDFLPFGDDPSARVLDQTDYAAATWRALGFDSGIAVKENLNKVWRQASVMVAAIAAVMAARTGDDVLDDGNLSNLETTFARAITAIAGGVAPTYAVDSGAANAMVITPNPAFASLATGQPFLVKVGHANTGAATLNVSGIGAKNVLDQAGNALASGALVAGRMVLLVYDGTAFQWVSAPPVSSFINTLPHKASPTTTDQIPIYDVAGQANKYSSLSELTLAANASPLPINFFLGMM